MTRRDFVIALNGFALTIPFLTEGESLVQLKRNSVHTVEANTKLLLPKNARKGQFVHLVVPSKSVRTPSTILFENTPILKENENLSLDSFGLFKMEYHGKIKGWLLHS